MDELAGFPILYNGIIKDSFAQGSVSGGVSTGGLIGSIEGGILLRCYAVGTVTGSSKLGGLIGYVSDGYPFQIEQSFWDITASNQTHSARGIGLNTEAMLDVNTFLIAGWDFTGETTNGLSDFWTMTLNTDTYPQLAWDVEPEAFLLFEFNEDPDWATQGQWQFGKPQGLGGTDHGRPDPNSGYTGNNVYGVNLSGDYNSTDTNPYFLTAGPFDCSQYSWKDVEYDIGSIANRQPNVYIRWGYQVLDSNAWPFSGWNIDDVSLRGIQ